MTESELLFCDVLKCGRLSLYLNKKSLLNRDECARISLALKRRARGEPLQYILGKSEFMGLTFKVAPEVLIPRPETEILVETALRVAGSRASVQARKLKILDIGTGSGCVAVSLAKFLPEAEIYASDISAEALEVAKENASLNNVNIEFIQSDLFSSRGLSTVPACRTGRDYGLIVSNPPYIPSAEIAKLQPEIQYEPRAALDGGADGASFFRRIIRGSLDNLCAGGFLIMEMGFNQAPEVGKIFQKYPDFEIIEVAKDYSGIERVIVAKKVINGGHLSCTN
ncbi:MAG: peptide chain release factor N(5)-glutamine methyltransferase [Candidatus Omnitrophota bacterium]